MKSLCQASEHTIDYVDVGFFFVNFKIMCFYCDFVIIIFLNLGQACLTNKV